MMKTVNIEETDRDYERKAEFIQYLEENPDIRFWQAVRNFSPYSFIYASNKLVEDKEVKDTFYWE